MSWREIKTHGMTNHPLSCKHLYVTLNVNFSMQSNDKTNAWLSYNKKMKKYEQNRNHNVKKND
jgi:hypothetical protein